MILTTFFTRSLAAGVPPETDSGRQGLLTRTSFITTMAVLSQRTGSLRLHQSPQSDYQNNNAETTKQKNQTAETARENDPCNKKLEKIRVYRDAFISHFCCICNSVCARLIKSDHQMSILGITQPPHVPKPFSNFQTP